MSIECDDIRKLVNVNTVARLTKSIGKEHDEENFLLITSNYILNLNPDQFWKVQCKLEAKKTGVWYLLADKELCEDKSVSENQVNLYFNIMRSPGNVIASCNLCIVDADDIMLYKNNLSQYVGIQRKYIEMFKDIPNFRQTERSDTPIAAGGMHVITPVRLNKEDFKCLDLLA
ncbi:MAG TPA: hypothetical protein PKA28_10670 [Methylomusa anaerophila]|uniref:Uncharacterized protein n=1 Tax=Methylomusa anaerophila TaxID=1930071 RepID=A0A348AIX9_9FIRM|nr:hypothetical protein [Methylomusa anaerophila]BBB91027.1 hypothetical protein MAMMFC1_01695 [Methylomusa anaerophila]HML88897.1 hypothetical protein [Methylomusa anaerophila]